MGFMVVGPPRWSGSSIRSTSDEDDDSSSSSSWLLEVIGMCMNASCTLLATASLRREENNTKNGIILKLEISSNPGHVASSFEHSLSLPYNHQHEQQQPPPLQTHWDMIFSKEDGYLALLLQLEQQQQQQQYMIVWTCQEPSTVTQERYEYQHRPFLSNTTTTTTTTNNGLEEMELPALARIPSHPRILCIHNNHTTTTNNNDDNSRITCLGYVTSTHVLVGYDNGTVATLSWRRRRRRTTTTSANDDDDDNKKTILVVEASAIQHLGCCTHHPTNNKETIMIAVCTTQCSIVSIYKHHHQEEEDTSCELLQSISCDSPVLSTTFLNHSSTHNRLVLAILLQPFPSSTEKTMAQVWTIPSHNRSDDDDDDNDGGAVVISSFQHLQHSLEYHHHPSNNNNNYHKTMTIQCHPRNSHCLAISTNHGLVCVWDWYTNTLLWKHQSSSSSSCQQYAFFCSTAPPQQDLFLLHVQKDTTQYNTYYYPLATIHHHHHHHHYCCGGGGGVLTTRDSILFYQSHVGWREVKVPLIHSSSSSSSTTSCRVEKAISCSSAIAVSATKGLAILDLHCHKWRLFSNVQQEQSITVHDFLWWNTTTTTHNNNILLAIVQYDQDEQNYYLVAYSKYTFGTQLIRNTNHPHYNHHHDDEKGWKLPHDFLLHHTPSCTLQLQLYSLEDSTSNSTNTCTTAQLLLSSSSTVHNYYYYQLWNITQQRQFNHSSTTTTTNLKKISTSIHLSSSCSSKGHLKLNNHHGRILQRVFLASESIFGIITQSFSSTQTNHPNQHTQQQQQQQLPTQSLFQLQAIQLTSSGPSTTHPITIFQSTTPITNYWFTNTKTTTTTTTTQAHKNIWTFTNQDSIVACWALSSKTTTSSQILPPMNVITTITTTNNTTILNHEENNDPALFNMVLMLQELDFATRMDYSQSYFGKMIPTHHHTDGHHVNDDDDDDDDDCIMTISQAMQHSYGSYHLSISMSLSSFAAPLFLALAIYDDTMKEYAHSVIHPHVADDAICAILHSTLHQLYTSSEEDDDNDNDDSCCWKQIQHRLLTVFVTNYHPLQVASLMARMGRQLEEHYLPYLFPLLPPSTNMSCLCRYTVSDLFQISIQHDSYTIASSLLPLLPQQQQQQQQQQNHTNSQLNGCYQLLQHSLSCLLIYYDNNNIHQIDATCQEGISLLPQIISYTLKLEDSLLFVSSFQLPSDEEEYEPNHDGILSTTSSYQEHKNDDENNSMVPETNTDDSSSIGNDNGESSHGSEDEEPERRQVFFKRIISSPWKRSIETQMSDDLKISKAASRFIYQGGMMNSFSSSDDNDDDDDDESLSSHVEPIKLTTTVRSLLNQWMIYIYNHSLSSSSSSNFNFWEQCHFLAKLLQPLLYQQQQQQEEGVNVVPSTLSDSTMQICQESIGMEGASLIYEFAQTFGMANESVWQHICLVTGIVSNQLDKDTYLVPLSPSSSSSSMPVIHTNGF